MYEFNHVPEPTSRFEVIKNLTLEEMTKELIPMIMEVCEDGVPSEELILSWLSNEPGASL